ncbi:transposase family protein [Massilia cavernae]
MNPGMILVQRLRGIDDPRVCDHVLVDFLVIVLCAVMAGAEGWDDIEAWGDANEVRGSGSACRGQRALHVVSACASEIGLVLGQQRCVALSAGLHS